MKSIYFCVFVQRLQLIINYLGENEMKWSVSKIHFGSSINQECFEQRIQIALSSMVICRMMIDHDFNGFNQSLMQYRDLFMESKFIKLDLLRLINDSHCFYLETKLSCIEKQTFLQKVIFLSNIQLEITKYSLYFI